jgi:hypothetical protein
MREFVKKRRMNSKTFDLGGRKRMLRTGIRKPLHYVDQDGRLADIDVTPTLDRGQHFISKAPYKVRIGRDFPGYRYTGARGTISAELVAINGNPIAKREPDYADKRFYWRGISLDTDCTIIPRNARLDAIVTLHSENSPRSFTWEILGDKTMMRPVIGRDAKGLPLELEQDWTGDRLTIKWTGSIIDGKRARKSAVAREPVYPVWIDPTVNEEIVAGADDASSNYYGNFDTNNTVLVAGSTGISSTHYAGLRFQSIAIPQGVTIDSAILTIDVTSVSGTPSIRIYGNDVDNAAAWADPGNLIKNITKTTAFVSLSPVATGITTAGVSAVVQEIMNRVGWNSNNAIAFFFEHAGGANEFFNFAAYEHATRDEAQLDITYTEAGGGGVQKVVPSFVESRFVKSPLVRIGC